MKKRALITGITGQDGSYLAELLLSKDYEVYGLVRRTSNYNYMNIEHMLDRVTLIEGDMTDLVSLMSAVKESRPNEVYNLAAQSYVATSFKQKVITTEVNYTGVLNILEAVKEFALEARFYQASTSEMFGNVNAEAQNEDTPFKPTSAYAIAKLAAHWATKNFRNSYGMYTCSGILFNHESERRGLEFVTRKVTDGAARIKLGRTNEIRLGNLEAKRDWGFAGDAVEAMWLMLQQDAPETFVIATGKAHSVRQLVQTAFGFAGIKDWEQYVIEDPKYRRPSDLLALKGDPTRARQKLGWEPKMTFEQLIERMVKADIDRWSRK